MSDLCFSLAAIDRGQLLELKPGSYQAFLLTIFLSGFLSANNMVLEDVVDYSADPVPKGVFQYSTGGFGLGTSCAKNCWGDGFLPNSLHTDMGGAFSPSFFSPNLPFALTEPLRCYRVMEKWFFNVQTLLW